MAQGLFPPALSAQIYLYLEGNNTTYLANAKYILDNKAEGSTWKNLRSHTVETKHEVCWFYMASRVSMKHRSHWPSCLTDLEYSNCCYAADIFHLQAFAYLTLACFVKQSKERQQTRL